MNVNHEHRLIWWAPERCGTKAIAHIFSKLGFEFYERLDNYSQNTKTKYQSHSIDIPEELSEYKVIFSTRNPYDRVLSLFINFTNVGKRLHYDRDSLTNFIDRYEIFINELFTYDVPQINKPILNNYILKYSFTDKVPDMIIRMESMIKDLSKIDFIRESSLWKSGYIHDYLLDNEYINKKIHTFNKVYTLHSAKMVYEHHIKNFILSGYDPFSFTTETLSNEDKMKFIHNNL